MDLLSSRHRYNSLHLTVKIQWENIRALDPRKLKNWMLIIQLVEEEFSCGHWLDTILTEYCIFRVIQPRGGVEKGPAALRKAGLVEKLKETGNFKTER